MRSAGVLLAQWGFAGIAAFSLKLNLPFPYREPLPAGSLATALWGCASLAGLHRSKGRQFVAVPSDVRTPLKGCVRPVRSVRLDGLPGHRGKVRNVRIVRRRRSRGPDPFYVSIHPGVELVRKLVYRPFEGLTLCVSASRSIRLAVA
jgi:hypothetical protein